MIKRTDTWDTRSTISRWAHILERTGLALTGASCGLFVAAHERFEVLRLPLASISASICRLPLPITACTCRCGTGSVRRPTLLNC